MDGPSPATQARRHRALGDPTRLRMVELLGERERTVSELARLTGASRPVASRHTAVLADCGLIERERRGMYVVCRLAAGEPVPAAAPRDPDDLTADDPEAVALYLAFGPMLMRFEGCERTEWDRRMIDLFGGSIRPKLTTLRVASVRLARGECLDGLPLPPAVFTDETSDWESCRLTPAQLARLVE